MFDLLIAIVTEVLVATCSPNPCIDIQADPPPIVVAMPDDGSTK